jgi:hypothetical protein
MHERACSARVHACTEALAETDGETDGDGWRDGSPRRKHLRCFRTSVRALWGHRGCVSLFRWRGSAETDLKSTETERRHASKERSGAPTRLEERRSTRFKKKVYLNFSKKQFLGCAKMLRAAAADAAEAFLSPYVSMTRPTDRPTPTNLHLHPRSI